MRTEELKIKTHRWVISGGAATAIELKVQNTGTPALTMEDAQVNNQSPTSHNATTTLDPGDVIWVRITYGFVNGTKYDLAILTTAGNKYTYTAKAPS